jgi:hypothetical protein
MSDDKPRMFWTHAEDWDAIDRGCDLGDSVGIRAYRFPHVDQTHMGMIKWVEFTAYQRIQAKVNEMREGKKQIRRNLAEAKALIDKFETTYLEGSDSEWGHLILDVREWQEKNKT